MGTTIPSKRLRPSRREVAALLFLLAMLATWLLMPAIRQAQAYHAFADRRALWGIPNAADVLSSLAFVATGLFGLWRLRQPIHWLGPTTRASVAVLFAGLALTGLGSAWYHLHPTDGTLVWDRLPMTVAFAGVYGGVLAQRVSERSGIAVLVAMLFVGPASVVYWAVTSDISLYNVVQSGLIAGVLLLIIFAPNPDDRFPWWILLAAYVVAKLVEVADAYIWSATNALFAGHAIKHLAAALGALAIANALRPDRAQGARATAG
jgi:hypothetical protein